jgi:hypothetical protein
MCHSGVLMEFEILSSMSLYVTLQIISLSEHLQMNRII